MNKTDIYRNRQDYMKKAQTHNKVVDEDGRYSVEEIEDIPDDSIHKRDYTNKVYPASYVPGRCS